MGRAKKRTQSKSQATKSKPLSFHAFWSGSLSFGLVNVPVLVFPGQSAFGRASENDRPQRHAARSPLLLLP